MITMVCIYKIKVLYLHQIINLSIHFKNFRLMKNNELLKSMPVSQLVSAESLLITTTKSNGKYKQKFQHLPQNYKHNSWT